MSYYSLCSAHKSNKYLVNGTATASKIIIFTTIINPKPWNTSDHTNAIINPIKPELTLPSKIGAHDLSYAVMIADLKFIPRPSSSFSLSRIKILLSTHIPILRIIAAIPDSDNA